MASGAIVRPACCHARCVHHEFTSLREGCQCGLVVWLHCRCGCPCHAGGSHPHTTYLFAVMSTDLIAEWPDDWNGRGIAWAMPFLSMVQLRNPHHSANISPNTSRTAWIRLSFPTSWECSSPRSP